MKKLIAPFCALAATAGLAHSAVIIGEGEARNFASGGNPDGWSGVSVLETAVIDNNTDPGAGEMFRVDEVSMFAGAGRATGTNHFQALLVNGANEIAWIGPTLTPTADGYNAFQISGAPLIPAAGGPYRLGVWQWNDGVDDTAGGTVAFAGAGGGGMFQQNLNGTLGEGAIAVGQAVSGGHASGAGGRDYHIDMAVTRVPEPSIFPLIALGGLGLFLRRRR